MPMPDFPTTNDLGLAEAFERVAEFNLAHPPQPDDCAVVVGASGLLSVAEHMPETIFVTDRDPLLLEWVAKNVGALLASPDRNSFFSAVHFSGHCIQNEHEIFENNFFLASEERFFASRQALVGRTVGYVCMDYGREGHVATLARMLYACQKRVRLFNGTNMHRYIRTDYVNQGARLSPEEYVVSLEQLPWADSYQILSSQIDYLRVSSLPVQTSLEGYAQIVLASDETSRPAKKRNLFHRLITPS